MSIPKSTITVKSDEIKKIVKLLKQLDVEKQRAVLLILKGTSVLNGVTKDVFDEVNRPRISLLP